MFLVISFVFILYFATLSIHRLYFSPISSFPGPRLAAWTFWYEFWYDVVLRGQYVWKIQEMHERYGPIIRINPEELHIDDPSFYDQIYTGPARRTNKWPWSAQMFGTNMAAVGTVDHDIHRQRRAALSPFFSKKSITGLEPIVQAQIDKLCLKLVMFKGKAQVINLSDALTCLSADIISDCAFGESYGLLDKPEFSPEWRAFMMELSLGTHLMKQLGWAYRLVTNVAPWLLSLLHPLSRKLDVLRRNLRSQIKSIRASVQAKKDQPHRTFFHALLSGDLPESEKSTARLTDEALTIIGAGTVTTSHTLALTLFHILNHRSIKENLEEELRQVHMEDNISWNKLGQLPYLTAVITEGLRLAFGVSHRLQRINPDTSMQYQAWTIPAGTPVSQTQMFIMTDPVLFPRPKEFIPERWMADALPTGFPPPQEARKHFVPFSRGTRACVGMNLAYEELYLTIGTLLRPREAGGRFEMVLFETSGRDFEVAYDWFNPCPPLNSKGLRVKIV